MSPAETADLVQALTPILTEAAIWLGGAGGGALVIFRVIGGILGQSQTVHRLGLVKQDNFVALKQDVQKVLAERPPMAAAERLDELTERLLHTSERAAEDRGRINQQLVGLFDRLERSNLQVAESIEQLSDRLRHLEEIRYIKERE